MLLYYATSKENAESIKRDGFSSEYLNKRTIYGKAIRFTNSYNKAKSCNEEVIKVNINTVNCLKLDKVYNMENDADTSQIQRIMMYLKTNSNKNCLVNTNDYVFFSEFKYDIVK
jgi:hypothetical protein